MAALSVGGKWGLIGGGLGLAGGITLALAKRRARLPQQQRQEHDDSDTPYLDAHGDLASVCLELAQFRHVAPREFRTIRESLELVLEIAARAGAATRSTVNHAWPGMVRHAAYRGAEALRLMHAKLERVGRGATSFNEAATEIQTAFDSCQHNVTLDVSCAGG